MEVTGTIKKIEEEKTFGTSNFRVREFVVTTAEQYPQMLLLQMVQDKCDLLDNFQEGQNVKVSINLRGREWINPEGKAVYFNTIQGWKIDLDSSNDVPQLEEMPAMPSNIDAEEPDDLPF